MAAGTTIRANGFAEMAYTGDVPWHGNGNRLEAGASIEEWITAAGMDFTIQRALVRYAIAHGADPESYRTIDDKHVLLRSDTKAPLGIVSDRYQVVQPKAVLEFFRDLTAAAGFTLETAGTLFGGKRFWALAAIGETAAIADPADKMRRYLMLSTACDGTMATEGRYVDIRTVCNNTLEANRATGAAKVKVSHRTTFNERTVKQELGVELAHSQFSETMNSMRRLADTRLMNTDSVIQTAELFHPGASKLAREDLVKILDSRPVARIGELAIDGHAKGSQFSGVHGTQWGWLNAVTEYVDHEARAHNQDNRLNSAWFGKGAELKERAYEMAMSSVAGSAPFTVTTFRADQGIPQPASVLDDVLAATV